MSDSFDVGDLSFGSDENVQEPKTTPVSEPVTNGNPFLNEVNPQHRAIVAPYLQKWDANATKKFQEYSAKLKPWEGLGLPLEEVQKHLQVSQRVRENPEQVFRLMWEMFQDQFGDEWESNLARIIGVELGEEMSEEYEGQQQYQDEPDPDQVWRSNIEEAVTEIREWRAQQDQLAQEAEQESQLETLLENMHSKLGDFDDDHMLLMLTRHNNVADAVKAYNAFVQRISQQGTQRRQVPKTMSGGQGGVPNGQVDVNKARGKDRRSIVEAMLEAGAQ